jgi:hypothetical protein
VCYLLASTLLFSGCGGGVGASAPSLPRSIPAPPAPSGAITLQLPADANGGVVAAISDALIVGGTTTNVPWTPITVSFSASANATSALPPRRRLPAAQPARPSNLWHDGPDGAGLLEAVLARLKPAGWRSGEARTTQSLPARVGSQANIWVQYFQAGVPGTIFSQIPATLALQTAHANVWVENSLSSLLGNQSVLNAIGANIETAMASDNAHFGTATWDAGAPSLHRQYATCDAMGKPDGGSSSEWILPSDPHVNFVYVAPNQIGVGGYMDADSLMPEDVIRCTQASNGTYHSNEAPTIVLAYYGDTRGVDYVLREDSIVHPAHEYQHLINIVHHAILQPQPQFEDPLLNEGLSMLAQDLALSAATGSSQPLDGENLARTTTYLSATQNYSVAGFAGVQSPGGAPLFNCGPCYSPAWLFQRYLYDRFGGDAYAHAMESGGSTSWGELQAVTGVAPQALLHDFAVALAASNTAAAGDPRYRFASLNLRATYVDQFGNSIALDGPAPLATLTGNGTQTVDVLLGAYVYFAIPASTTGASASLSDGANGNFDLDGFVIGY